MSRRVLLGGAVLAGGALGVRGRPWAAPAAGWPESTPEAQGLDGRRLAAAVDYLAGKAPRDGVRELLIARHGHLVWKGEDVDKVHGVWSVTKSFTSTVLGLLVDDGRVTLDTPVAKLVPALKAAYPRVTLRHLTTMTSGYRAIGDEPQGTYRHGPSKTPLDPDPSPLFAPPGSRFAYWDSAMNQLAHALTKAAGEPLAALFRRRIAEPIGMDPAGWRWGTVPADGLALNGGAGNLGAHVFTSAREIAKLGQLMLGRGRWGGRRLLSERWIAQATRPQVRATVPLGAPDLAPSAGPGCYGFNWWCNGVNAAGRRKWPDVPPTTFSAAGHNNNDMFVIPPWDLVIVRLGLDQGDGGYAITDEVYGEFLRLVGLALKSPAVTSRPARAGR